MRQPNAKVSFADVGTASSSCGVDSLDQTPDPLLRIRGKVCEQEDDAGA